MKKCYYYGLKPSEVLEMLPIEMAEYVEQCTLRQRDDYKMLAQANYAAGVIGSMALSKRLPKFEEVFNFPKDEKKPVDVNVSKAHMIALASEINRVAKNKRSKEVKDGGRRTN